MIYFEEYANLITCHSIPLNFGKILRFRLFSDTCSLFQKYEVNANIILDPNTTIDHEISLSLYISTSYDLSLWYDD